jgi:T5orf172 domain
VNCESQIPVDDNDLPEDESELTDSSSYESPDSAKARKPCTEKRKESGESNPAYSSQSDSNPSTPKPKSAHARYHEMIEHLKRPFTGKEKKNAYVYVWSSPDGKSVKIGYATRSSRSVPPQCTFMDFTESYRSNPISEQMARKVESLSQTELCHFRLQSLCKACKVVKRGHREGYCVDASVALPVVERWFSFIKLRVYDSNGNLSERWKTRIDCHFRAHPPPSNEKPDDHESRHDWWTDLIEHVSYLGSFDSEVPWRTLCCLQALTLLLMYCLLVNGKLIALFGYVAVINCLGIFALLVWDAFARHMWIRMRIRMKRRNFTLKAFRVRLPSLSRTFGIVGL